MRTAIRLALDDLAALSRQDGAGKANRCKICGSRAPFFDVVDFHKFCSTINFYEFGPSGIPVSYFRCGDCDFMFTDFFDDWSTADFAQYVYNQDYVRVDPEYLGSRPDRMAGAMKGRFAGSEGSAILDYGSGAGVFVDRLRAVGFADVSGYDPFSNPERPGRRFDLITCFEVIEHSTDPAATIADMQALLKPGGCIVLSQALQPTDIGSIRGNWWYVAPRNGHISFFTRRTLARLANARSLRLWVGDPLFAFADTSPTERTRLVLRNVGSPWAEVTCNAPPPTPDRLDMWHAIETSPGGQYRWTRSADIRFPISLDLADPAEVEVSIPFVMGVTPGFSERCRIRLGNQEEQAEPVDGSLRVRFQVESGRHETVSLITPEPISPFERDGSPDNRKLGIAIRVGASRG